MSLYLSRPNREPAHANQRIRFTVACLALLTGLIVSASFEYVTGQTPPKPVGEDRATLQGHKEAVTAVTFSPNGKLVATAAGNQGNVGELKIWNASTHEERGSVPGLTSPALALAFSPDSKTIAVGCGDGTVRLGNVDDLQFRTTLKGHVGRV